MMIVGPIYAAIDTFQYVPIKPETRSLSKLKAAVVDVKYKAGIKKRQNQY